MKMDFWDVTEVAEFLGTTPANIRVLTHRGRLTVFTISGGRAYYDADKVRDYALVRRRRPKYPTIDVQRRRKGRQFPK